MIEFGFRVIIWRIMEIEESVHPPQSPLNKLTPVFLCVGPFIDDKMTSQHCQSVVDPRATVEWFHNKKNSKKSNLPVKMKKTQQNLWVFWTNAMLLSITFLAWRVATEDKQRRLIG